MILASESANPHFPESPPSKIEVSPTPPLGCRFACLLSKRRDLPEHAGHRLKPKATGGG